MLLLLHALIPCLAAYKYTALNPCVAAYTACPCPSTIWHCHPYILQYFNGNLFTLVFRCIETVIYHIISL